MFLLMESSVSIALMLTQGLVDQTTILLRFTLGLSGIRTTISAIGYVYIKRSQDPLDGIRHFECMDLISSV